MGKQVNFWMLPEDESIFMQYLRERKNIVLLKPISSRLEVEMIEFDLILPSTEPTLLIWDKTIPIKDENIVPPKRLINSGKYDYYEIDRFDAPVIEYSRSLLTREKGLLRGRIWAEMYLFKGQERIYKGSEFEDFYNTIARWLRRNLTRIKELYAYMGSAALKWYREGGRLIE
jgi:hypothetical protein